MWPRLNCSEGKFLNQGKKQDFIVTMPCYLIVHFEPFMNIQIYLCYTVSLLTFNEKIKNSTQDETEI